MIKDPLVILLVFWMLNACLSDFNAEEVYFIRFYQPARANWRASVVLAGLENITEFG